MDNEKHLSNAELDRMIAQQQARLAKRPEPGHVHTWGTAYQSSGGRKVCTTCGFVTDKPFETLGVGESAK